MFALGALSLYNVSMSFLKEALKDKPSALYMMDDTSPFQDYSGYNQNGVQAGGTPATHASLVQGASYSQVFTSAITATLAIPVFNQGFEKYPFTLEAWVRVTGDGTAAEQQILGNSGKMDGLTINGTVVSFVTKYLTATEARASYDVQVGQTLHVVGVHTQDKNSLYVNGELVDEVTITDVQQADKFNATNSNLYCGATSGTQKIAVNGLAGYGTLLNAETVKRHYQVGTAGPTGDDIPIAYGGVKIPLTLDNANIFLNQTWSTAEQWNQGMLFNTAVVDDELVPQFSGTVSVAGQWLDSFAMDTAGAAIQAVYVDWEGTGATVEASLNGTVWTTVQRGTAIGSITPGYNPSNELQIRISFPGGIDGDESYVSNLNIVGTLYGATPKIHGRTVTLSSAVQDKEYPPLLWHSNWGAQVSTGGTLTISADSTSEAKPIRTIEVWARPVSDTVATFGTSATNTYQNGGSGTSTLVGGRWTVYHRVLSADLTGTLTLDIVGQVGQVVLYPTALTLGQVSEIYAQYVGTQVVRVNDTSTVQVTETTPASQIYEYDWAIASAG